MTAGRIAGAFRGAAGAGAPAWAPAWTLACVLACASACLALPGCGRRADVVPVPPPLVVAAGSPLRQALHTAVAAQTLFEEHGRVAGARMVTTVPAEAPVLGGSSARVFVEVAPWAFSPRPVTLGPRVGSQVAVLAGLAPGDRIAVPGDLLAAEGRGRPALP